MWKNRLGKPWGLTGLPKFQNWEPHSTPRLELIDFVMVTQTNSKIGNQLGAIMAQYGFSYLPNIINNKRRSGVWSLGKLLEARTIASLSSV